MQWIDCKGYYTLAPAGQDLPCESRQDQKEEPLASRVPPKTLSLSTLLNKIQDPEFPITK